MTEQATQSTEGTSQNENYESPSIGSLLPTGAADELIDAPAPEVSEPAETPAPSIEVPVPTEAAPPAVTPPAVTAPEGATPAPAHAIPQELLQAEIAKATRGLVAALQAERQKRQQLEDTGLNVSDDPNGGMVRQLRNQLMVTEERMLRAQHSDYDEHLALFAAEAERNPGLAETVLASDSPAFAAYQVGQNLKIAKEFGPDAFANPHQLVGKVREQTEKALRSKIEAELRAEFDKKLTASATERANTPTDITQARAAGGETQPYQSPGLGDVLSRVQRRR